MTKDNIAMFSFVKRELLMKTQAELLKPVPEADISALFPCADS
jgi:hypothetical protein